MSKGRCGGDQLRGSIHLAFERELELKLSSSSFAAKPVAVSYKSGVNDWLDPVLYDVGIASRSTNLEG